MAWPQAAPVTGRVLDAATQQPVPYAVLTLPAEGRGTVADSSGWFTLGGWVGGGPDSLVVTTPGYQQQTVARPPAAQPLAVALLKIPLPRYNFTACPGPAFTGPSTVGSRTGKPGAGQLSGGAGSQYALFITPPERSGALRSAAFFIDAAGLPRTPFRVRLYAADEASGAPGSDLLLDNIIVRAVKGGRWFFIDLTPYHVIPVKGFYLALEWLAGAGNLPELPASQLTNNLNSPALCLTSKLNNHSTWHYLPGRGWQPVTLRNQKGEVLNAMVKAEVNIYR